MNSMQAASAQLTDKVIKERIAQMVENIFNSQRPDGAWNTKNYPVGETSLAVLALSTAGVSNNDARMQKAIAYLEQNFPKHNTYCLGLYACALQTIHPKRYQKHLKIIVDLFIFHQRKGSWNYIDKKNFDNSTTQFALLGLKAAKDAGIDVPQTVFDKSAKHFLWYQNKDGSWAYRVAKKQKGKDSMTAAGLASLAICGRQAEESLELEKGPDFCGQYKPNPHIALGMQALANYIKTNPNSVFGKPYTAYAVERVGILYDKKLIGGQDWYAIGAEKILGSHRHSFSPDYCFQLLFLAKGDRAILFNKIIWGQDKDWNNRHADVRNAVQTFTETFIKKVDWQQSKLDLNDSRFGQAPILYISGRKEFILTESEKEALKSFVDDGGTVLFSPCLNSAVFKESVEKILKEIYPGTKFADIPQSHEVRRMIHDLQDVELPLQLLKSACVNKQIFYATVDISLEFEKEEPSENTVSTLANLIKFSLEEKPLIGRLDTRTITKKKKEPKEQIKEDYDKVEGTSEDGIGMAQILFGDTPEDIDPEAMNNQLGFMRKSLQIPTRKGINLIQLTNTEELNKQALLYMTGNKKFTLSPQEILNLKNFLKSGGFLFADSACSCDEFHQSFKELVGELYPSETFEQIALDSPIYQEPFKNDMLFTESLKESYKEKEAFLMGLRRDERYVIIYSPLDFSSALANRLDEASKGIMSPAAYRLVTNIISYALSY